MEYIVEVIELQCASCGHYGGMDDFSFYLDDPSRQLVIHCPECGQEVSKDIDFE
ncbi:MAG: hypothetical protein ACOC1L_04010 [Bacillota bacterium]